MSLQKRVRALLRGIKNDKSGITRYVVVWEKGKGSKITVERRQEENSDGLRSKQVVLDPPG